MHRAWEELAPGVVRRRLPRWDATAGAVGGRDALLLVDAGSSLREGAGIRVQVRALFGRPVSHVALTHPHFDHVLGAAAFAGVEVHGPAGMAERLRRDADALCADAVRHGLGRAEAENAADALAVPRRPVAGERVLDLGGGREALLADLGAAHSPHDMAVCVPGSPSVVFCGDLVEESGSPQAGPDASPALWPAALDRLLELGGDLSGGLGGGSGGTVYVPGHGAAVDAGFVRAQRDELARRFG